MDLVKMIDCPRCSLQKPADNDNPHICVDCAKVENSRASYYRQHNFNWMDVAKEAELEVWERQPSETDTEWYVWLAYRDAYPARKPTYSMVAAQLNTTLNVVKKVGQRWDFPARLQAWAKYVDKLTLDQRKDEILAMNKTHIGMAQKLNEKLRVAIDNINPATLEPRDIQGLLKLSSELERKARMDEAGLKEAPVVDDGNPILKKSPTKTEDLGEIVQILSKAGALNPGMQLGIRKTTTTEVVLKDGEE